MAKYSVLLQEEGGYTHYHGSFDSCQVAYKEAIKGASHWRTRGIILDSAGLVVQAVDGRPLSEQIAERR